MSSYESICVYEKREKERERENLIRNKFYWEKETKSEGSSMVRHPTQWRYQGKRKRLRESDE